MGACMRTIHTRCAQSILGTHTPHGKINLSFTKITILIIHSFIQCKYYVYTILYALPSRARRLHRNCDSSTEIIITQINNISILLKYLVIASEASFLVCSTAQILYVSGRTSFRKCSRYFYVYLNIRPMRYSTVQI